MTRRRPAPAVVLAHLVVLASLVSVALLVPRWWRSSRTQVHSVRHGR